MASVCSEKVEVIGLVYKNDKEKNNKDGNEILYCKRIPNYVWFEPFLVVIVNCKRNNFIDREDYSDGSVSDTNGKPHLMTGIKDTHFGLILIQIAFFGVFLEIQS